MAQTTGRHLHNAQNYLETVKLPSPPMQFETAAAEDIPIVFDDTKAVTIGSQITEFTPDVPGDIRSMISNSILLAQLAANKATENDQQSDRWYAKFTDVFNNIGWIVKESNFQRQEIDDKNAELHEAIIPVIMGMLAPQSIASSVIVSIFNGLKSMDPETPWLTLFEREARRFEARHFQLGFAAMDEAQQPKVSLMCFELEATHITTQVLFFKFTDASAVLRQKATALGISPSMLLQLKPDLDAKLSNYVKTYIKGIEI